MNAAPRRFGRPLRSFLILACVAGAVIAADKTWLADWRSDFPVTDWWSSVSPVETKAADIAIAAEPANQRAPELSINELRHGMLFSKPSTSWRLEPEKAEFASAWMTPQSSETFSTDSGFNYQQPSFSPANFIASSAHASTAPAAPAAPTGTDGTWIHNGDGDWSLAGNWQGGIIASGAGATAHLDLLDITTDVTVTLDSSRTIGQLLLGDTDGTNSYDFPASIVTNITFDNVSGNALLQQSATSAGDTVGIGLFVKSDLNINNLSTTRSFTITGDIASLGSSGSLQNLFFNEFVTNPGAITVSGNISNGNTGAIVQVEINGGTVTFRGENTYTGQTFIGNGATFVEAGNNGGATGTVFVVGTGSVLSGKGIIGGDVQMFGGSTITANSTTSAGTLTLLHNVTMGTSEGQGGIYLANLEADLSDLLLIGGQLSLGVGSTLDIEGTADGVTTYTLAMFGSHSGVFATVSGVPSGYDLVYSDTDLELVPTPIPEPATWIGGALALGAIAFVSRRRLHRRA